MDQLDETVAEPAGEGETVTLPDLPAPDARWTLRLAMTLHPVEGGYRALLAVGADDCDPLMQHVEVAGWPALAQALQDLTDAAAIRWHDQPRNPSVTPIPKPTPTPKRSGGQAAEASTGSPSRRDDETPAAEDDDAPSGQLALFDPGG